MAVASLEKQSIQLTACDLRAMELEKSLQAFINMGSIPVKLRPKTRSSTGTRPLGEVVLVIDRREGSMPCSLGVEEEPDTWCDDLDCEVERHLAGRENREASRASSNGRG